MGPRVEPFYESVIGEVQRNQIRTMLGGAEIPAKLLARIEDAARRSRAINAGPLDKDQLVTIVTGWMPEKDLVGVETPPDAEGKIEKIRDEAP